jgi:hypothetical protein
VPIPLIATATWMSLWVQEGLFGVAPFFIADVGSNHFKLVEANHSSPESMVSIAKILRKLQSQLSNTGIRLNVG